MLSYVNILPENERMAVSMLESNLTRATTILHLIENRHCSETVSRDGLNAHEGFGFFILKISSELSVFINFLLIS